MEDTAVDPRGPTQPSSMDGHAAVDPNPTTNELLLDRYVVEFVDELADEIERGGAPPLSDALDKIPGSIPASLSGSEWEDARQQAMDAEILRYRKEVEEPAAAILRHRKASQPSAVNKVEVACLSSDDDDVSLYREILDGIEPELQVTEAPGVSSLTLRVSWAPDFSFRHRPFAGFVSSVDRNVMVLYVGTGRPCDSSPWFYLVYDSRANSVSVVPQLPSRATNSFSHGGIGTRVAVLRHRAPSDYVLAELLLCRERGFTSNKADLFLWWSSGDCTGRWIQKSVTLPLPCRPDDKDSSRRSYDFHADTVLPAGSRGLCWVDLLQGVLICDDVLSADACLDQFSFIPLPEECVIDPGVQSRGVPSEFRSVSTYPEQSGSNNVRIRFLTMDGHGRDRPISGVALTVWTIQRCNETEGWQQSEWAKGPSVNLGELLRTGTRVDVLGLQPIIPILSRVADDVVYLCFYRPYSFESWIERLKSEQDDGYSGFVDDYPLDVPTTGPCVLRLALDIQRIKVVSVVKLPPESIDFPRPYIFATDFNKGD